MIRFDCDYNEGAHPLIIKKLTETNLEQTPGYGEDEYCESARQKIRELCDSEDADVWFLVGGTQANTTVICATLRPHQGVVAAESGHINTHESGAIEATGHKVLTIESGDGKITAQQVREIYESHWKDVVHEHTIQPGMVYISHPTETGTTYTKPELTALSAFCREAGLPLYMDGARLGYGLMSEGNDLTLKDIAGLCDVFYIGGTKVGALFGEAVVITKAELKKDFRYIIKQRGGLLAKGRLLGIQFDVLFEDGLYFGISQHAVELAMRIRKAFSEKGITFLYDSKTNQQFPILSNDKLSLLDKKYVSSYWSQVDESHTAVRFCTGWATREEDIEQLVADIAAL